MFGVGPIHIYTYIYIYKWHACPGSNSERCDGKGHFCEKVGPDGERRDIFGKKYAKTLRGVTMICQNRKELGLVLEKWRTSHRFCSLLRPSKKKNGRTSSINWL